MSDRKPIDTSTVAALSLQEGYTLKEIRKFIEHTGIILTKKELGGD
jgi:hypothetical protein